MVARFMLFSMIRSSEKAIPMSYYKDRVDRDDYHDFSWDKFDTYSNVISFRYYDIPCDIFDKYHGYRPFGQCRNGVNLKYFHNFARNIATIHPNNHDDYERLYVNYDFAKELEEHSY